MTSYDDTQVALPTAGDETQTLLGALDRNRRTFAWKCFGLSAGGDAAHARRRRRSPWPGW